MSTEMVNGGVRPPIRMKALINLLHYQLLDGGWKWLNTLTEGQLTVPQTQEKKLMGFKRGLMGFRKQKNRDTHGWEWQQSRTEYPIQKTPGARRSEQQKFSALTCQFMVKTQALLKAELALPDGRVKHLKRQVENLSKRIKETVHENVLESHEEEAGCALTSA